MTEDALKGPEEGEVEQDNEAVARLIDDLMAGPPAGLPEIVVFGDEAVFGIRPAKRAG